jgi:hypothetical protein
MQNVAIRCDETKVLVLHVAQATRQQTSSTEQHHGKSCLQNHQRLLSPSPMVCCRAIRPAQRLDGICPGRQPGRADAKKNTRQQGNQESKPEHRQRRTSLYRHRLLLKRQKQNDPGSGERHHDSCNTTQHRQHDAFGQGLPDQGRAGSAVAGLRNAPTSS